MFDLLIRNATLIDGTGAARRTADVAVRGDRIASIDAPWNEAATAQRVIDAEGLVVAPGFVDVHNHSDGWLVKTPHLVPKTSQGFTTEVLASDGISYAPVTPRNYRDWIAYLRALDALEEDEYQGWCSMSEYMARIDRHNVQNAIMLIPYANVRVMAAGWRRGAIDDSQMKVIRRAIETELEAGAAGMSTGLDYIAQCFSTTDELVEACTVMAPYGRPYVTHVRYKKGTLAGVQEAVEIGRRAGVPVHISHLKAATAEETDRILSYVDRVATREVDFSFDIYPYLAGSTMLNFLLPYEVWEDGPLASLERLRDPAVRDRLEMLLACYDLPAEKITIAWCSSQENRAYHGWTLSDYAARLDKGPAEALRDLVFEENLAALMVLHLGDDRLVDPFLAHPKCVLGSDGIYFPDSRVHPRVYGSATRMLGPLVRERKLFSLEEAVRKMSGASAARFGLADRGVVRAGAVADLVVFDPESVADRATYDDPHQLSTGIEHVIVSGVEIFAHGKPIESLGPELPGRALRYGA